MEVVVYEVQAAGQTRRFLSFLPKDKMQFGLPEQAILGEVVGDDLRAATIALNLAFFDFLNQVLIEHGHEDAALASSAKELGNGALHVVDQRFSKSGEPPREDILGTYEVKDGAVVRYHPNQYYAVKADQGFVRLPPDIFARWLQSIESLDPWDSEGPGLQF